MKDVYKVFCEVKSSKQATKMSPTPPRFWLGSKENTDFIGIFRLTNKFVSVAPACFAPLRYAKSGKAGGDGLIFVARIRNFLL